MTSWNASGARVCWTPCGMAACNVCYPETRSSMGLQLLAHVLLLLLLLLLLLQSWNSSMIMAGYRSQCSPSPSLALSDEWMYCCCCCHRAGTPP
jgi:hypothetical protein